MNNTARNCAERRAAYAADDIDRLLAENAQLAEKAKRFEQVANELRDSHLDALETISNGIAREDAMRTEIERLGGKLLAATQAISELNDRIVSANILERARRTGVAA